MIITSEFSILAKYEKIGTSIWTKTKLRLYEDKKIIVKHKNVNIKKYCTILLPITLWCTSPEHLKVVWLNV
jgi:hypothetical protein